MIIVLLWKKMMWLSKKEDLSYWQKRFLEISEERDEVDSQYIKDMQVRYSELSYSIEDNINSWIEKYAVNDKITQESAEKLLSKQEQKSWTMELSVYREKAIAGGYEQELNREYYTSRITRLEQLNRQLYFELAEQASIEKDHLNYHLQNTLQNTYNRTIYEMTDGASFGIAFDKYNSKALQETILKPWKSSNFSKRIWRNHLEVIPDRLSRVMSESVTQGYGIDKTVKMMMEGIDKNLTHRMTTLVQSESAHIAEVATDKAYDETGVEQYQWLATLEAHTCEVCQKLDLQIFDVADKSNPRPPDPHPNCRCTTIPYIEGWERKTRWHRDPITGKGGLTDFQSYEEWAKKHVTPEVKEKLRIERNRPADRKQHQKYKELLGKNVPRTLDDFVDLKYNNNERWTSLKKDYRGFNHWNKANFPSVKSFEGHFVKHREEFGNISQEKYLDGAQNLLKQPTSNDILGYTSKDNRRVRFNTKTNEFALGKDGKITTYMKPEEGLKYYERNRKRDME